MATDAVVMEPAGEWVAAFEVQQRFLRAFGAKHRFAGLQRTMQADGGSGRRFL